MHSLDSPCNFFHLLHFPSAVQNSIASQIKSMSCNFSGGKGKECLKTFIFSAAHPSVANFRGFLISRIPKHYSPSFFLEETLIYCSRFLGVFSQRLPTQSLMIRFGLKCCKNYQNYQHFSR